jgi:hypothetical protein
MKKSRFTGEQIAFALRQAETGTAVTEAPHPGDRGLACPVWISPSLRSSAAGGIMVNHKRVRRLCREEGL